MSIRTVAAWIASCALAGCSFFVSLDDLQTDANAVDSGVGDASDGGSNDGAANDAGDGATAQTYEEVVLSDSPVAYWRLGDTGSTMLDQTTNKLDGTYGPAASPTVGLISGTSDPGTAFSGAPDGGKFYVGAKVPESHLLEPATTLTIECWFRASNTTQGELLSYGPQSAPPYQPYDLQINPQGSGYHILFYTADVGTLLGATNIEVGKTYHLVGTYDGSNLRIYLNGVPDGVGGNAGAITSYDAKTGLGVGGGAAFGDFPFIGTMDEIAIYDHVLSPARIAAHYAAGTR